MSSNIWLINTNRSAATITVDITSLSVVSGRSVAAINYRRAKLWVFETLVMALELAFAPAFSSSRGNTVASCVSIYLCDNFLWTSSIVVINIVL